MKMKRGRTRVGIPLEDVDVVVNTDASGNIVIAVHNELHVWWLNAEPEQARLLAFEILRRISNPERQVA